MNLRGEPVHVGDRVHAAERQASPAAVSFYRATFGEAGSSSDESGVAPSLLFHSEVYQHVDRWYLKNLVGNLHARQEWQFFAPLRVGAPVQTRSTIVERYQKRGRDYVVNEVDYNDDDGRLLVRGRTHQSFLPEPSAVKPASDRAAQPADAPREGGFVVDESTAKSKQRRAVGEGPGPELEPVELLADREVCWRFSGPGRNYHTDPDAARELGFPRIVVQGLLSTCLVAHVMEHAFGAGWREGGRMDVKLTNVVWADDRLRARAKLQGEVREGSRTRRHFEVWVEKDDAERTVVNVGTASALS